MIVDPPDGAVFQDQCYIPVKAAVDFMDYKTQFETEDFDFLFVLDRSGSMLTNDPEDYTKQAAINLLNRIPAQKSVASGVVIFGGGEVVQPLTTDRSVVQTALENLPPRNLGTDITSAIETADQEFKDHGRPQYAKFMILLSDGEGYSSGALTLARDLPYPIHTFHLGLADSDGARLLQDIAQVTGGNYTQVNDPYNLPDLFEKVINTYTARVVGAAVTSSYDPGTIVYGKKEGDFWVMPGVAIDGPTTLTCYAWTNEIPPRGGQTSIQVVGRTGGLTDPVISIDDPTEMEAIDQGLITVTGSTSVEIKKGIPNVAPDPCIDIHIQAVETSTTALPHDVIRVEPVNGLWEAPEVPIRQGPGQMTLIYSTAITTDYPPKRLTTIRKVIAPLPCLPIAEVATDLNEPTWEPYNRIAPFDPLTLTDTGEGLDYHLPGPVTGGYFGFYQERQELCGSPTGINAMRVFLGPHRSGTQLLPDCRVRIFKSDDTRSFFCRVNELNGRSLPAYLDVPYMSDGRSGLRMAVDLMAFDQRNGGGWSVLSPLVPESTWSFPIHSSIGSAAAGTFEGEFGSDASGSSVAGVGDVNGDGYDDFLIGARDSDRIVQGGGKVYLILGGQYGWHRWTDLWFAQPSFVGEDEESFTGTSVAGVGDVNGDGLDDFVIGAPENAQAGVRAGKVYLFLGRRDGWPAETPVSEADASFVGEAPGDELGSAVAGVGDVDGDGYADFIIGAPYHSEGMASAGKVYLFRGRPMGWASDTPVSQADASFDGIATNQYAGSALGGAGDVNGDGYKDFLIGAPGSGTGGTNAGESYLILGKQRGWVKDFPLDGSPASFVGEAAGDQSGTSVAGAGDVNGDGFDDILIGAPHNAEAGQDAGKAYLILGKTSGWSLRTPLSQADASFLGEKKLGQAGFAVAKAGDINGDGLDDFLIGAIHEDTEEVDSGAVYLVPGARTGWHRGTSLSTVPYSFHGENSLNKLGYQMAAAGDVNGDGFDDFIAGAPGNADGGSGAGHTYLILGSAEGPRVLAGQKPPVAATGATIQQALADLSETSWEPFRQIAPYQEATLTDTADGLDFQVGLSFTTGYFAFYQTRDSFPALPAGLHYLRVHLKPERVPGHLLPDIRVRVFTEDNSVSYFARYTEAAGGTLPTEVDVPFVSDGVWPFRVAVDLMSFDTRMYGGWTVTGIDLDP